MTKSIFVAALGSLLWTGAAYAMPIAPIAAPSPIAHVRTLCDQYGRCCATGSGECYSNRPRPQYYVQRRQYYAPPAYEYDREPYRERYQERRSYYGAPSVGVYGGYGSYGSYGGYGW